MIADYTTTDPVLLILMNQGWRLEEYPHDAANGERAALMTPPGGRLTLVWVAYKTHAEPIRTKPGASYTGIDVAKEDAVRFEARRLGADYVYLFAHSTEGEIRGGGEAAMMQAAWATLPSGMRGYYWQKLPFVAYYHP